MNPSFEPSGEDLDPALKQLYTRLDSLNAEIRSLREESSKRTQQSSERTQLLNDFVVWQTAIERRLESIPTSAQIESDRAERKRTREALEALLRYWKP